jgi:uncharacterized protein (DUF885 family)
MLRRRQLLAGLGTALLLPAIGRSATPGGGLRPMLDRAAAIDTPAGMAQSLRRDPVSTLGPADAAIHRMVLRGIERAMALQSAFPFGKPDGSSPYVVSPRHGAWLDAGGKADPAALARRIDAETDRLRAESARGIAPPAFMILALLRAQRERVGRVAAEARLALLRQIAVLEALRPGASPVAGMWRLPQGEEYYRLRLGCTSGSDLAPLELDRLVGAETQALLARADRLFRRIGLPRGSVGARFRALKRRPADLYTNDDAGRNRAVADMQAALARVRPHLADWFNPPLELGSRVARLSPADEAAGKRGYRDAPADGRPGIYFPDLSSPPDRPRWTLVTVAHHETIPGHMLQFRRQALAEPHRLQVKYAAGYAEGWAIYAESLVDRMGLLSAVEQLGFIQSVLFRLARVTADIGLHVHRWDRPRALRYLQETVGFDLFFPFDVEVDRYCAEPAGFAGDALCATTLMRLGARRSGAGLRRFHDAVLDRGPVSAEVLKVFGA